MRYEDNPVSRGSIMLIDDEIDSISFMKRLLVSAGILNDVLEFLTGGDAASYLGEYIANDELELPKMLLLDLHMPKMDGFQFLWWLRAHARFDTLPVVVMSTADTRASLTASRRLGADGFLLKYPHPEALRRAWKIAMARRSPIELPSENMAVPREIS